MRREAISVCRSWMVGLLFMEVDADDVVPVVIAVLVEVAAAAAMADLDARGRMSLMVNDDDEPLVNVDCGGWDCLR